MPTLLTLLLALAPATAPATRPAAALLESVDLEPVWSAHPVGFALLTHGDDQFAGYYDAQRRMTVAHRKLGQRAWTFQKLPRTTAWDSHNYVTMAVDSAGHLHVAGDMHAVPLVYFRTARPLDVTSLEPVHRMTGAREDRVTYPVFLRDAHGALLFRYRDGKSGNGDDLYNRYDPDQRRWRRLIDQPVVSGLGKANAYCSVPHLGPDGRFHMVWVWRDTPDASTNHDPSYARSPDLVNWETAAGAPLRLPITPATPGVVVDPVPARGGVINGNVHVGFDSDNRPIVTYHKYDPAGQTQIYAARRDGDRWVTRQLSDWAYRWEFGGGGTLVFEVGLGPVKPLSPGRLALAYRSPKSSGTWVLDERTLTILPNEPAPRTPTLPRDVTRVESRFPGMAKRTAWDVARGDPADRATYALVWESLPQNRDRPRQPPFPDPVMLRVVRIPR